MSRALVIVDIQNDYFPGGALALWEAEAVERRIVEAIAKARQAGDAVVLIQHLSLATSGLFALGSPGSALRPAILAAAPDAPVVTKEVADAFQGTTLASQLDGVDELLIGGMMTQNCIAFTTLAALAAGRAVTVVGDLCTAPLEVVHRIALNALASKTAVRNAAELW
ncbi:isochorismatase family protein [Pseudomonas oryzihabitans]|uniref:cysteine hydrolase family protein n=1 Tax=Pseudomonas oryzihabitans TaxID=47885 RepID=UPI0028958787|nr:isochorismatase family protein [Pseudomonas oryzihabitans]MDT3718871.1 isochorismatase family protein [Pseudomonas oryzihabitans]